MIDSIIVDPQHRNEGVGTKLMNTVLQKCGRPVVLLATSELGGDLDKLFTFYKRFGFKTVTRRDRLEGFPYNYNMILWE